MRLPRRCKQLRQIHGAESIIVMRFVYHKEKSSDAHSASETRNTTPRDHDYRHWMSTAIPSASNTANHLPVTSPSSGRQNVMGASMRYSTCLLSEIGKPYGIAISGSSRWPLAGMMMGNHCSSTPQPAKYLDCPTSTSSSCTTSTQQTSKDKARTGTRDTPKLEDGTQRLPSP